MTPNELYQAPWFDKHHHIEWLVGNNYTHVPEVTADSGYGRCLPRIDTGALVTVRDHAERWHDPRRSSILRSVWFRDRPIMICANAGREGEGHVRRWVTDLHGYVDMCQYLRSILLSPDGPPEDFVVDPGQDIPRMTDFYGDDLLPLLGTRRT